MTDFGIFSGSTANYFVFNLNRAVDGLLETQQSLLL